MARHREDRYPLVARRGRESGQRSPDFAFRHRRDHRLPALDGRPQRRRLLDRRLFACPRSRIDAGAHAFERGHPACDRHHGRAAREVRRRIRQRIGQVRVVRRLTHPPQRLVDLIGAVLARGLGSLVRGVLDVVDQQRKPVRQHGAQE